MNNVIHEIYSLAVYLLGLKIGNFRFDSQPILQPYENKSCNLSFLTIKSVLMKRNRVLVEDEAEVLGNLG